MAPARGRPSATASRREPTALPEYQPPGHPLNLTAQSAIRDLPRAHKLDSLKSRLRAANHHLTESAAEINDRYQDKHAQHEKRKAKRAVALSSQESNEEAERELDEMRLATEEMTARLEAGVRKVIDSGEQVKGVEEALRELDANITAGRGVVASTQSTLGASQFIQSKRRRGDVEDDDEDEEMGEGAVQVLKQKIWGHQAAYQASSMTDRYASHNDYVGFKKIVHDAHYPDEEAPPMPHASTWFGEAAGTQSSSNGGPRETQPDSDDDLIMASERISVKCPITLTEMKDPVSSTKCPHNFEKQAILEMISTSDLRVGGDGRRGGEKAMRCPVGGCDVVRKRINPRIIGVALADHAFPFRYSVPPTFTQILPLSERSSGYKLLSTRAMSPTTTKRTNPREANADKGSSMTWRSRALLQHLSHLVGVPHNSRLRG